MAMIARIEVGDPAKKKVLQGALIEAMDQGACGGVLRRGRDLGYDLIRANVPDRQLATEVRDLAIGTQRRKERQAAGRRAAAELVVVPAGPLIALPPPPKPLPPDEEDPHRGWLLDRIRPNKGLPYSQRTPADRAALRVFRGAAYLQGHLRDMLDLWNAGDTISLPLQYDVCRALGALGPDVATGHKEMYDGAHQHLDMRDYWIARRKEAEEQRPLLSARRIILGNDKHVPRWGDIGTLYEPEHRDHGRPVAVTLHNAEVALLLGKRRSGKTYGGTALAEGAVRGWAAGGGGGSTGLAFHSDWVTGAYHPEQLSCLEPNEDPDLIARLWQHHLVEPNAYENLSLIVLPDMVERTLRWLGPLRDRVEVHPLLFGPTELGKLGYRVLAHAYHQSKIEPRYMRQLSDVLEELGEHFCSEDVIIKVEQRVHGPGRRHVLQILQSIGRHIHDEAHLGRHARAGVFNLCDFSGQMLDPTLIMSLTVATMNSFALGTKVHCLMLLDELNKYMKSDLVAEHLGMLIAEARKRLITLCLMAQNVDGLPARFVSLAGIVGVFRMLSHKEYAKVQNLFAPFLDVPFRAIKNLPVGHAMMAATRSTDEKITRVAREVQMRPLCTMDGGEDRTA